MELVPRDLEIMDTVGQLGTADTEILRHRHFPKDATGRACQQRLRKLTVAGLLKRVRLVAVDSDRPSGSLPALFFLTPAGGDLVERESGSRPPRITMSDPKPFTLRHRRAIVQSRVAIDLAAGRSGIPSPDWIMEQDCHSDRKIAKGQSPSDRLILFDRFQVEGNTVSFRPDASCRIQVPHDGGVANLLAYLEVDRSTECHDYWRNRKLRGIEAFLSNPKAWQGHWPGVTDARIRILVICKTSQRLANLANTLRTSRVADRIRLTTYPLDPCTVLTGKVWIGCGASNEPAAIMKSEAASIA
jgi:hypothetical protein